MLSTKFNLIEQLQIMTSPKTKDSINNKYSSFDQGDIADMFRRMYEVANLLASREGLTWIQVKHKQDLLNKLHEQELAGSSQSDEKPLSPLLETQLLDFVTGRREEYMQRMTKLLELYAKTKWTLIGKGEDSKSK